MPTIGATLGLQKSNADGIEEHILPPYHPFRSEAAKREYLSYYDLRAREWPVPAVERLVKTSQGHTRVRVSGPSEASPLVL
jgi:hypothetical protein